MDAPTAPQASTVLATLARARWGVGLIFFVNGAAFASWVSRIPALRASMALSDGALGSVLFAMSCGVLLSFPLAGKGAQLLGARQLALVAGVVLLLMLPMPFLIGILPSLVLVMLEVGAALGTMQVAMNVLAVDVQARVPRPIMSSLHGAWSAGGLFGAGVGSLAAHAGLAPLPHLAGVAVALGGVLLLALLLLVGARLPARSADAPPRPSMSFRRGGVRADRVLLGLGMATVVPTAFAAAGRRADALAGGAAGEASAARAVALLSGFGYTGLLLGPPLIGWLAQATPLTWALGLLVLLVAAIVALVPLLGDGARAGVNARSVPARRRSRASARP